MGADEFCSRGTPMASHRISGAESVDLFELVVELGAGEEPVAMPDNVEIGIAETDLLDCLRFSSGDAPSM